MSDVKPNLRIIENLQKLHNLTKNGYRSIGKWYIYDHKNKSIPIDGADLHNEALGLLNLKQVEYLASLIENGQRITIIMKEAYSDAYRIFAVEPFIYHFMNMLSSHRASGDDIPSDYKDIRELCYQLSEEFYTVRILDYTDQVGGRYAEHSDKYSGEWFRDDVILPKLQDHQRVIIDLGGTYGLPDSFLEEVFGGLIRNNPALDINRIQIRLENNESSLLAIIHSFMVLAQDAYKGSN